MIALAKRADRLQMGDKVLIAPDTQDSVERVDYQGFTTTIWLHGRTESITLNSDQQVIVLPG